jgi:hypothetical protein
MYQGQPRSRPDALPDRGPAVGAPGTRWGAIGYNQPAGRGFPLSSGHQRGAVGHSSDHLDRVPSVDAVLLVKIPRLSRGIFGGGGVGLRRTMPDNAGICAALESIGRPSHAGTHAH